MLSDELRRTLAVARQHVAEGTMTEGVWDLFYDRIADIAARLEHWERSATPGPAARLSAVPDNVVWLDGPDRKRNGTTTHPPGDAA